MLDLTLFSDVTLGRLDLSGDLLPCLRFGEDLPLSLLTVGLGLFVGVYFVGDLLLGEAGNDRSLLFTEDGDAGSDALAPDALALVLDDSSDSELKEVS